MDLGDVVVAGLGKSGSAAATFCARHMGGDAEDGVVVRSLTVYGGARTPASESVAADLAEMGATVVFDTEEVVGKHDLALVSPGIPQSSGFYRSAAAAASGKVWSEPELAFRISPQRWIGITGTNGKTTTTTLVEHILKSSGVHALACGNIGLPCIEAIGEMPEGAFKVAELSSFQLSSMPSFAPMVAVLLNITPDHVEWHGDLESYELAKQAIFAGQDESGYAVVDCTDKISRAIAERLTDESRRVICIGGPEGFEHRYRLAGACAGRGGCAYARDGRIVVEVDGVEHLLARVDDLSIKGDHNLQNALAASSAAVVAGLIDPAVSDAGISEALATYSAIEHRLERAGVVGGVEFCNDSKATNVDAASKALTAFPDRDVVMLLGGHDKGTDLAGLVAGCRRCCREVICYGEAGPRLAEAFEAAEREAAAEGARTDLSGELAERDVSGCTSDPEDACRLKGVRRASRMADAFELAVSISRPGDVVLLSPACSSFDEFRSYEERGRMFKDMVVALAASVSGGRVSQDRVGETSGEGDAQG